MHLDTKKTIWLQTDIHISNKNFSLQRVNRQVYVPPAVLTKASIVASMGYNIDPLAHLA